MNHRITSHFRTRTSHWSHVHVMQVHHIKFLVRDNKGGLLVIQQQKKRWIACALLISLTLCIFVVIISVINGDFILSKYYQLYASYNIFISWILYNGCKFKMHVHFYVSKNLGYFL